MLIINHHLDLSVPFAYSVFIYVLVYFFDFLHVIVEVIHVYGEAPP